MNQRSVGAKESNQIFDSLIGNIVAGQIQRDQFGVFVELFRDSFQIGIVQLAGAQREHEDVRVVQYLMHVFVFGRISAQTDVYYVWTVHQHLVNGNKVGDAAVFQPEIVERSVTETEIFFTYFNVVMVTNCCTVLLRACS